MARSLPRIAGRRRAILPPLDRVRSACLLSVLACRIDEGAVPHEQRAAATPAATTPASAPRPEVVQLGADRFRPGGWVRRVALAPGDTAIVLAFGRNLQLWSLAQGIAIGEPRSTSSELEELAFVDGGAMLVGIDRGSRLWSWPVAANGLGEGASVELGARSLWSPRGIVDVGHGNVAVLWGQPFAGDRGAYEVALHRRTDGVRDGRAKLSSQPFGIWPVVNGFVVVHTDDIEVFDVARAGRRGSLHTADGKLWRASGAAVLADGTTFVLVDGVRMSRWDVRTRKLLETREVGRPLVGCDSAAIAPTGDRLLCEPPVDPPWIARLPADPTAAIDPRTHVPVERTTPLFDADELVWTADATKLVDTRPWWTPNIWDAETGRDLVAADGPLAPVRDVVWLAADRLLAIDGVGDVREWDPWTKRMRTRAAPMRVNVEEAAFSPAGDEIAMCRGGGVEIRTLGGAIRTRSDGACKRVAWIGDEALWVSGADELRRLDVRGDVPIQRGTPHAGPHGDVLAVADAGRRVATAAGVWNDEDTQVWTPPDAVLDRPAPRLSRARALALAADQLLVADDRGARLFPLGGGAPVLLAPKDPEITAVAFAPDRQRIALGDANGRIFVVLADGTATTIARTSHRGPVRRLWWREQTIVSAGDDTTIVLWSPFERG